MKFLVRFVSLFVLLVGVTACSQASAQVSTPSVTAVDVESYTLHMVGTTQWAVPEGMDIEKYPVLGRKLTEADVLRMKLRLDVAPRGMVLWNADSKHGAFWLDIMRTDRKVWVNEVGEVVYIEDCGNRAMRPSKRSILVEGLKPTPLNSLPETSTTVPSTTTAPAQQLFPNTFQGSPISDFVRLLLGGLLFAVALLALLWLVLWLGRQVVNGFGQAHSGGVPQPVAPAPVPPAPMAYMPPQPGVPGPPAPPAHVFLGNGRYGENGEVWYGPFQVIVIGEPGEHGHQVTVDGRDAGNFREEVRSVNAGVRGQWLVVPQARPQQ